MIIYRKNTITFIVITAILYSNIVWAVPELGKRQGLLAPSSALGDSDTRKEMEEEYHRRADRWNRHYSINVRKGGGGLSVIGDQYFSRGCELVNIAFDESKDAGLLPYLDRLYFRRGKNLMEVNLEAREAEINPMLVAILQWLVEKDGKKDEVGVLYRFLFHHENLHGRYSRLKPPEAEFNVQVDSLSETSQTDLIKIRDLINRIIYLKDRIEEELGQDLINIEDLLAFRDIINLFISHKFIQQITKREFLAELAVFIKRTFPDADLGVAIRSIGRLITVERSKIELGRVVSKPDGNGFRPVGEIMAQLNRLFYEIKGADVFNLQEFYTRASKDFLTAEVNGREFYQHAVSLGKEGRLPQTITIHEYGPGNGRFAGDFLNEFRRLDEKAGTGYYQRLNYTLIDFSEKMLKEAMVSTHLWPHRTRVTAIRLDAAGPLPFDNDSVLLVRFNELYDDLPGQEIIQKKWNRYYRVQARLVLRDCFQFEGRDKKTLLRKKDGTPISQKEFITRYWHGGMGRLKELDPVFLEALDWEWDKDPPEIDIAEHPYGDFIRGFTKGVPNRFIPINHGAISHLRECLRILHPYGYIQCYDYGFSSPEGISGQPSILRFSGQPTTNVNFALLQYILERQGSTVTLETQADYLSRFLGEKVRSRRLAFQAWQEGFRSLVPGIDSLQNYPAIKMHWQGIIDEGKGIGFIEFLRGLYKEGLLDEVIGPEFFKDIRSPGFFMDELALGFGRAVMAVLKEVISQIEFYPWVRRSKLLNHPLLQHLGYRKEVLEGFVDDLMNCPGPPEIFYHLKAGKGVVRMEYSEEGPPAVSQLRKGGLISSYWLAEKLVSPFEWLWGRMISQGFKEDVIVPIIEEIALIGLSFGHLWFYWFLRLAFTGLHAIQDRAPPKGKERTLYEKVFIPTVICLAVFLPFSFSASIQLLSIFITATAVHIFLNLFVTVTGARLQKGLIGKEEIPKLGPGEVSVFANDFAKAFVDTRLGNGKNSGLCVTGDTKLPVILKPIHRLKDFVGLSNDVRDRLFAIPSFAWDSPLSLRMTPIVDVKAGDYVLSLNEEIQRIEPHRINGLLDMGIKPVYRLTTASGKSIETTANHPYLTRSGWVRVSGLREGSEIAVPNYFLTRKSVSSTTNNLLLNALNDENLESKFFIAVISLLAEGGCILRRIIPPYLRGGYINILEKCTSLVINTLFSLCASFITSPFLAPLCILLTSWPRAIRYSATSRLIFSSIRNFILRFNYKRGIFLSLNHLCSKMEAGLDMLFRKGRVTSDNLFWGISSFKKFQDQVYHYPRPLKTGLPMADIGICGDVIFNSHNDSSFSLQEKFYQSLRSMSSFVIQEVEAGELRNDILWDRIVSIEYVGLEQVYDIEVEGTHNFIGNGIFAHNTYIGNPNVSCGTICESGHEGPYNALDSQLKRQFEKLRRILTTEGTEEKQKDLTEEEADRALVEYAKKFGIEISVEELQGYRRRIKEAEEGVRSIEIFFAIPETGTELFWAGDDYAGGHFNRAGTRIHISLPIILEKKIEAGIAIARHEMAHIQGKGHKEDSGLRIVKGIAEDSAEIERLREWRERERFQVVAIFQKGLSIFREEPQGDKQPELLPEIHRGLTTVQKVIYRGKTYMAKYADDPEKEAQFIFPQAEILNYLNGLGISGICKAEYYLELENGRKIILLEEFPQGETLVSRMERKGKMPVDEAVDIILRVSRIVRNLHEAGVYHWDIKLDNIWITDSDEIILFDFDLAFRTKSEFSQRRLYKMGAPPYKSLNRIQWEVGGYYNESDEPFPPVSSEVYSLGITLLLMLVGHGISVSDVAIQRLDMTGEIPQELIHILCKAVSGFRCEYKTVEEFMRDLKRTRPRGDIEWEKESSENRLEILGEDEGVVTRVYKARYEGEIYWAKFAGDDEGEERFVISQAEIIKYLNGLNIPGVCRAEHFLKLKDGRKAILFRKFPPGGLLEKRKEKLSEEERIDIMLKILYIVRDLHRAGVRHWDIKLENIWLTDSGEVILFDFDFAFRTDKKEEFRKRGLQAAMSPSYASEKRASWRKGNYPKNENEFPHTPDELYSLGMVLLNLIADSEIPMIGKEESPYTYATKQLFRFWEIQGIPGKLSRILKKALWGGECRYQDIDTLIQDFRIFRYRYKLKKKIENLWFAGIKLKRRLIKEKETGPDWIKGELGFLPFDYGSFTTVKEAVYEGKTYMAKFSFNPAVERDHIIPQAEILSYLRDFDIPGIPVARHFVEFDNSQATDDSQGTKVILFEKFPKGETLEDKLKEGRLSESEAIDIILKVSYIIRRLHKAGVYHWDIKPGNIWIADNGEIILFDFDLAFRTKEEFLRRGLFGMFTDGYESRDRSEWYIKRNYTGNVFPPITDEVYSLAKVLLLCVQPVIDDSYLEKNPREFFESLTLHSQRLKDLLFRGLSGGRSDYKTVDKFIKDLKQARKQLEERAIEAKPVELDEGDAELLSSA